MNDLSHQLRACLVPLADRTQGQLYELFNDTTEERADMAARAVYEVYTTLRRLSASLAAQRRQEAA
ncbi:hypothetical protein N799_07280 [Lysobacter arseniciresistens ZS79]|uniref:Uncharacterized protein n=1 Tax=Lysobacter arseniciresistens ZS79 TaxID=913325 RepID=A0A0A0EZB3_9GAMM|nr:hypothetical protein [Lysobacter arseniciresistens]KGM55373.1 hypothetical protein N799_07280 [Lysobacter arseniciresistens ZS79]